MKWSSFRNLLYKKRPKVKLKHNISIMQDKENVTIQGEFSKEYYCAKELWFRSRREEEDVIKVAEIAPTPHFLFQVNLEELLNKFQDLEPTIYDCYLKVRVPVEELGEKTLERIEEQAEFFEEDGVKVAEYFIRFGRFQNTVVQQTQTHQSGEKQGGFIITKKGNISFAYNVILAPSIKLQIDKIQNQANKMVIEGKMFTKNSRIVSGEGIVKGRNNKKEYAAHVSFLHKEEATIKKYGLNRYEYVLEFDREHLVSNQWEDDIYDFYLNLELHDQEEEKLVRIGRPTTRVKLFIKEDSVQKNDAVAVINPYFTFKASNLSLEVYNFPVETYRFLKKKMRWSKLLRAAHKKDDVWIVGERTYKAQDTGYHFFKHMRQNYPDKEVYYVIEKDSPEAKNVEPLGNVLYFKSKEHIMKTLISTRVISSHHPDYLYPIRTGSFKRKVKALKVFLQHGVMGTKNMVANYGKNSSSGFNTDIFLVSSDFEKDMIVTDFGYDENEVFVTGLSRFDKLFEKDVPVKKQLLVIPTWRDWITSDEAFLESEYFERYQQLIHHPDLHSLAKTHQFEIIFCLHPNMQKFTHYFQDAPVKVISQGEVDVQRLIKESAIMITDYSSVAFDFSFLHKPVIYYQFDRSRFIGKRPSHLNLDKDLPGDIVNELEELLVKLEESAHSDFIMKEEYIERANRFIKYRDLNSSERIYEAVQEAEKEEGLVTKVVHHPVSNVLKNRFRKSKHYFPIMKKAYKVMSKVLPVDKNLILFESGLGKQFSDSPKYIYEELLKRDAPYKKVWVYNNNLPVKDKQTKRIKRLSPEYYYYLAKAGYWVNNQNFPTYLSKRKETTYLQTWHGTPLKKMQFDIENIQGRDDEYLNRVHHATKTWDYLISPSPYASKAFRSAFRYEKEMLEVGYPRNDLFYRDDVDELSKEIVRKLKLPSDKKVILYAPTFRDNQTSKNNKFVFELNFDLEAMKQALGDEYILLLRMHVVISNNLTIPEEYRDFVMNVSKYPDIQELYLISDILMTDYSSVMFDFANTNRPILYYTYDLDDYRDNLRGFYIDFEDEAPGPLMKTTEDIIDAVLHLDEVNKKYETKYRAFRSKYCGLEDGKASERAVDLVFKD
ncbi:CDP-glycerol glycerophosphotransferase family protein [Peribacillus asahii]|uniref:CDP-glycerol glycerophosphotransferase family protein n=1 Tax=Peribacillus asahii TaxID=228899 RepID=UPI0037F8ED8A